MNLNRIIFLSTILVSFSIFLNTRASEPTNIYQYIQVGMFTPAVKNALMRVYVPNGYDGTVSVIDPATYTVIQTFYTGKNPQHVVPAYDLHTLWVLNNKSNSVTPIDPTTGKPGKMLQLMIPIIFISPPMENSP